MIPMERIYRYLLALAVLLFALFALQRGLAGARIWMQAAFNLFAIGAIILWLKDRYWILLPISMLSGFALMNIAGRNVRLSEIVVLTCAVIFFARIALLRSSARVPFAVAWPILLHLLWVAIVFAVNPVGLAVTGSQAIGARFYIMILMGGLAFIILACQTLSERDAKFIVRIAILLSFVQPIQQYFRSQLPDAAFDPHDFYTWHQALVVPGTLLLYYLLSRYRKINLPLALIFSAAMVLVLLSGKRAVFMVTAILPVVASVLLYRAYGQALRRACVMGLILLALVIAHGTILTLPRVAQRAMALLPGRWDASVEHLHEDVFRQAMRKLAWREIREKPLMGRRGYAMQRQEIIYMHQFTAGGSDPFRGHAYSANWHSDWLGFWVDFGLPAVLTYASFLIVCILYGRKVFAETGNRRYRNCLSGMILLLMATTIITSYTGGHSALSLYDRWWTLGLLIAIRRGLRQETEETAAVPARIAYPPPEPATPPRPERPAWAYATPPP